MEIAKSHVKSVVMTNKTILTNLFPLWWVLSFVCHSTHWQVCSLGRNFVKFSTSEMMEFIPLLLVFPCFSTLDVFSQSVPREFVWNSRVCCWSAGWNVDKLVV